MTHHLNIVSIRIKHERAVIVGVIDLPNSRWAIVPATRGESAAVKNFLLWS